MGERSELKVEAVPGFGFLPEKVVTATDLLFQVELWMLPGWIRFSTLLTIKLQGAQRY